MEFLSVISKGTERDKLMWTFTFYDVDHDGVISKEEMLKVCSYPTSQHQIQNGVMAVKYLMITLHDFC